MAPLFNFALACRGCKDARCVKACPEHALSQAEETGLIIIDQNKCKGCDWCVQACEHGGITIHTDTGKAISCDLCGGEPKCIEACPEEALVIVESDEAADKLFNDALENCQHKLKVNSQSNQRLKPLLATAEKDLKITEKLQELNKKAAKNKITIFLL
jgi:Fe-S-cluster-containing dehydrogenase component